MNNIDKQYTDLLQDILDNGVQKGDRTGTGTISVFGRQIRHKMSEGFPLLTSKKMPFKTIVTELLWFLRGDTNIKYLLENNCHIWDGDAYQGYKKQCEIHEVEPMSKEAFISAIKLDDSKESHFIPNLTSYKLGELGSIYGAQWRSWRVGKGIETTLKTEDGQTLYEAGSMYIDQIANLINDLKTNPDSRRLMVSAWNVGELEQMVLPPCHYGFQVYTRELVESERYGLLLKSGYDGKEMNTSNMMRVCDEQNIPTRAISLMWNQRSVDTFLGLPFNIASYGLLLEIIAKIVNMVPDELIGNLGDVHLYSNHVEQAKEQIGRKYTTEERHNMLKESMGDFYQTAIDEQVPFGGGLSEYYVSYNIPTHTREPYPLPTLVHMKTDAFWNVFDVSLFTHLDPTDFQVENYKSHPAIKAPLSN
jgi:thymidylate synthase